MNAPQTPYERFMTRLAVHAAQRPPGASWALYERLKGDFMSAVLACSQDQYEAAMRAVQRRNGMLADECWIHRRQLRAVEAPTETSGA